MSAENLVKLVVLVLGIALVFIGPICTIWSLNTLFPVLAIPYTVDTWVAVIILGGLFKTTITRK